MTSLVGAIGTMMLREMLTLRKEIDAYPSDESLWKVVPGISNSGGTLALHLAGNLQHFIGAVLGGSGYIRNRDAEFSVRGLSRAEVMNLIDQATASLTHTFRSLTDEVLGRQYPERVGKVRLTTGEFRVHLEGHLSDHLGQIDYHRRMTTGGGALSGAMSPGALVSAVHEE